MSPKYRLSPKPGLARTGRFVGTKINPVIIANKPNIVKIRSNNDSKTKSKNSAKPLPKIPQSQKVQRVNIQRSVPNTRSNVVTLDKRNRLNRSRSKSSPIRNRKEQEVGKYKKKIELLRNSGVGKLLVMVACGPSILEADLPKLKDHALIDIMSINKPDPRLYPTKYWVFCDQSQYVRNKQAFESYSGTPINAWSVRARHPNQILIRNKSGKGFSKDLLQGYYIGRSTTFANMQTALWMNYDKVFIFGCDMCQPPNVEKLHFYGRNEDVDPQIRVKRFQKEAEHYSIGAKQLTSQEKQKFVFCSSYNQWPFVDEFKRMDHKIAVDSILKLANDHKN